MQNEAHEKMNHYGRLLVMTILSFIAMYVLMYAMVDRLANVHPNLNQFYMAGLMAAAMVIIELVAMGGMYPNRSRIPHHGGAILMCKRAPIHDAEIQELCRAIILGQQREIEQMHATLRRLR